MVRYSTILFTYLGLKLLCDLFLKYINAHSSCRVIPRQATSALSFVSSDTGIRNNDVIFKMSLCQNTL